MSTRLKNIVVNGKRTSMRLEGFFWDALDEICQIEHTTRDKLLSDLDLRITYNLNSAVRVFVAEYFRGAATDCGHERAGHGSGAALIGCGMEKSSFTSALVDIAA